MKHEQLNVRQKALTVNLNPQTYGAFAEIGAGQEVASLFFKAGAASGTVAKTMSAYDKTVSDAIYGKEQSGRYVCESRLMKMMHREYSLLEERLKYVRPPDNLFFAFANSIVTLNFSKTNEGHGWVGIRFQLVPNSEPNDIILHIKMLDNSTELQQQAVGIVGVNLFMLPFTITTILSSSSIPCSIRWEMKEWKWICCESVGHSSIMSITGLSPYYW
jgi:hypothetical protein